MPGSPILIMGHLLLLMLAGGTPRTVTPGPGTPELVCDETQRLRSDAGHTLLAQFRVSVESGAHYSFRVHSQKPDDPLEIQLTVDTESTVSAAGEDAWICDWQASETGEVTVLVTAATIWGWDVTLDLFCGDAPSSCPVSVQSPSWSQVKTLYR